MVNCKECKHWNGVPGEAITLEEWWPCAKGVASLPDKVKTKRWYPMLAKEFIEYETQIQKLPWAIDTHNCPEFKET